MTTASASIAIDTIAGLQRSLADSLADVARSRDGDKPFDRIEWLRDAGSHGGGNRLVRRDSSVFDRASVNFSHVHYDDLPSKRLQSATALSAIIHPMHPLAPSLHTHISWTELKGGTGSWRLMADLNPAIPREADRELFHAAIADVVAPELFDSARAQGDKYFFIPSLGRHRGIFHFYLEGHATDSPDADQELATRFGEAVIATYPPLIEQVLQNDPETTQAMRDQQLAYHSLYFLQVLTLDRGTTSGLLVHNQNDVGILGSLPGAVDLSVLRSWVAKQQSPQDKLLQQLIETVSSHAGQQPQGHGSPVSDACRAELAAVVRSHYQQHPAALALQASGFKLPPTVANHAERPSTADQP